MRYAILTVLITLLAPGCATPGEIQYSADRHEARARQLEAQGRYDEAYNERRAADKQRAKAYNRASGYYW